MNIFQLLRLLLTTTFAFMSIMDASASETLKVRKQFADYYIQTSSDESSVSQYMKSMEVDGSWADIDYASQRRGSWPTINHLGRIEDMAAVYADPEAELFQSLELREAIVAGLNHWIENDYRNPNWWYARIGVPKTMGAAMILMDDDLPDTILKKARPILLRSKMGMTGQNKVWCAGNNVMIGLLYDESDRTEEAVDEIWSELRVSTEEGIQPDWSFHQHGPQQQFGNYGLSFAGDMIKWASILRGTKYELRGGKLEILRNYMLEGASWIVWHWRMDLSGCGRQIGKGAQKKKGQAVMDQLMRLIQIDPSSALDCYSRHDYGDQLNGFKPFWRSEMAVQRRPNWYASVKMSSKRVIGSETCNSENMQGLHLGDGTLLVYQTGDEYEDMVPLWDWKRLPGTTCDQGFQSLEPKGASGGYGGADFSGVLGDDEIGMAAMIYKRGALTAQKAWFFLEDHMVCLGAGISGETKGAVYTSVEQSWKTGDVTQREDWVQHAGTRYQILDGKPVVKQGTVDGDWIRSFPTRGNRPVSGDVFSVWIDHGTSPENATYAYRIFPNIGNEPAGLKSAVLKNTSQVQAVTCGHKLYAVFYEAGMLEVGNVIKVEVSGPCLLLISEHELMVSDPTHRLQTLEVKINKRSYHVKLPQGAQKGKQVTINEN